MLSTRALIVRNSSRTPVSSACIAAKALGDGVSGVAPVQPEMQIASANVMGSRSALIFSSACWDRDRVSNGYKGMRSGIVEVKRT